MGGTQVQSMRLPGQLLAKLLARPGIPIPTKGPDKASGKEPNGGWTASYNQPPMKWRISLQIPCDR